MVDTDSKSWSFPHVDSVDASKLTAEDDVPKMHETTDGIMTKEMMEKSHSLDSLNQETSQLKETLANQVVMFSHLLENFQKRLSLLSDDVLDEVDHIIYGLVKKIIGKEISQEPSLMAEIIKKYLAQLDDISKLTSIHVSEAVFQQLGSLDLPHKDRFVAEPSFQLTDVEIKLDKQSLRAVLDEMMTGVVSARYANG